MNPSQAPIDIPTVPYFLVLLVPGRHWDQRETFFAAHVAFIDRMAAANVVLLGGSFDAPVDGADGAYLLRTATRAEAEAWAAQDPLVANGAYHARIVAWHLVGIAPGAIDPALTG